MGNDHVHVVINTWYDIIASHASATINGVSFGRDYNSGSPVNFTTTHNLYMFAFGRKGSPIIFGKSRIAYCKVYDNGTLLRDFIPVRVGNVGYMYDKVSGQLFGNSGTGSFILGPDTKIIEPEIPKFIIRKKVINITNNVNPNFSVIKKHFETKFQLSFDTNGGNTIESKEVVLGKPYGELPVPIKSQHIFLGWFTSASGGT